MGLEVGRGVDDEGEAGGVGLGEAVEGEGGDVADDLLLGIRRRCRASAMPARSLVSIARIRSARALEAHGPPQLLGLAAGKAGRGHGHAQELLLEKRHAEGALQDRLQAGVGVGDRLAALAALEVGMGHLAGDRARPDDRHLHHQVVEAAAACCAAARPSAPGSRSGRPPPCRRPRIMRRPRGRPGAGGRGRPPPPRGARMRGIASSRAASMPRPSRSTLMMPRSAQSSLSHWMTVRPGMAAGSSGTTSSSRPGGDDHAARVLAEVAGQVSGSATTAGRSAAPAAEAGSSPAVGQLLRRGCGAPSRNSPGGVVAERRAMRSTCSGAKPSTLPTSRAAERSR